MISDSLQRAVERRRRRIAAESRRRSARAYWLPVVLALVFQAGLWGLVLGGTLGVPLRTEPVRLVFEPSVTYWCGDVAALLQARPDFSLRSQPKGDEFESVFSAGIWAQRRPESPLYVKPAARELPAEKRPLLREPDLIDRTSPPVEIPQTTKDKTPAGRPLKWSASESLRKNGFNFALPKGKSFPGSGRIVLELSTDDQGRIDSLLAVEGADKYSADLENSIRRYASGQGRHRGNLVLEW